VSTAAERDAIIDEICAGFVHPSASNREIYRVILEFMWPPGADLPGPVRTRQQIRDVVNGHRQAQGKKPYQDPFRRLRELQGEEGLLGIAKTGGTYQLITAEVSAKRVPRRAFSGEEWAALRAKYDNRCAVCREEGTVAAPLTPDHRVPRVRGGGDGIENIQLLCVRCNIHKSVACRGCQEDCLGCPWYDAVANPVVTLRGDLLRRLGQAAAAGGESTQALAERALDDFLQTDSDGTSSGGHEKVDAA
jgi:5-methylcytosine-specific restriction endonuclease McrA